MPLASRQAWKRRCDTPSGTFTYSDAGQDWNRLRFEWNASDKVDAVATAGNWDRPGSSDDSVRPYPVFLSRAEDEFSSVPNAYNARIPAGVILRNGGGDVAGRVPQKRAPSPPGPTTNL